MLDEWIERQVDRACIAVPKYLRPRLIRMSDSGLGWRICLYCISMYNALKRMLSHIKDEENAESFAKETLAKGGDQIDELGRFLRRLGAVLERMEARSRRTLFAGLLFLALLCALGVLATGSALLAGCAAALMFFFLGESMEAGYRPVSRYVRQRYLAAILLRAGGYGTLTLSLFRLYASGGLPTNIVLQSAMIVMLFVHMVMFLGFAAFVRAQQPMLRVLTGLLGVLPALAAAAALSVAASLIGVSPLAAIYGFMIAGGVMLLFLTEQLYMIDRIGLVPIPLNGLITCALSLLGHALLITAAWLMALM